MKKFQNRQNLLLCKDYSFWKMVGLSHNFTIVKNMRSDESRTLELFRAEKLRQNAHLIVEKWQIQLAICHSCETYCTNT